MDEIAFSAREGQTGDMKPGSLERMVGKQALNSKFLGLRTTAAKRRHHHRDQR